MVLDYMLMVVSLLKWKIYLIRLKKDLNVVKKYYMCEELVEMGIRRLLWQWSIDMNMGDG